MDKSYVDLPKNEIFSSRVFFSEVKDSAFSWFIEDIADLFIGKSIIKKPLSREHFVHSSSFTIFVVRKPKVRVQL